MRAVFFILLLGATAHAGNNEFSAGSSIRALPSSSANAITSESLPGGGLGYGRALDLELPLPKLRLWLQANIEWAGIDGRMFQTIDTELFDMTTSVGAQLRYEVREHLIASARIGVGSQYEHLQLTDPSGVTASDGGWGAFARGGLGLDVLAVAKPQFTFGFRFELGYLAASGVELVPRRDQDDTLKLPMSEASIGHLDLSGPYVNTGVIAQF